MQRLKTMLNSIDHKGYPAYKGLKGSYDFGDYRLGIDKEHTCDPKRVLRAKASQDRSGRSFTPPGL